MSDEDDRESGATGMVVMGGTINPRLLLGGVVNFWAKTENDVTLTVGVGGPLVRFYPQENQHFYVEAGLGAGFAELQFGGFSYSEQGGGVMIGLGYDLMLSDSWGITPYANFSYVSLDSDVDLNFVQLGVAGSYR